MLKSWFKEEREICSINGSNWKRKPERTDANIYFELCWKGYEILFGCKVDSQRWQCSCAWCARTSCVPGKRNPLKKKMDDKPYSHNLFLRNFCLFPKSKNALTGQRFAGISLAPRKTWLYYWNVFRKTNSNIDSSNVILKAVVPKSDLESRLWKLTECISYIRIILYMFYVLTI